MSGLSDPLLRDEIPSFTTMSVGGYYAITGNLKKRFPIPKRLRIKAEEFGCQK